MRRRRPNLQPLAPAVRTEDEGTWMLTFSDLVLLLLAFVAIGILMQRSHGPHVVTDRLHAQAPASAPREAPFALVEAPEPVAPAAHATRRIDPRLRSLAARIETRLAAEGIPGLRPLILDADGITVEIGAAAIRTAGIASLPPLVPERITVVETAPHAASEPERALARATRLAQELIAGDPLLAVHTSPARLEIRLAG